MRPSNGWCFSCGAEVRHNTILNDSAAWPLGCLSNKEPWPRSAVSYKRLLGGTTGTVVLDAHVG